MLKVVLTPIFLLFWKVKVEGREYRPGRGPAILAANHQSFCDSLFLPLVIPGRVTYLAKAEYFDSWKTAWFFRAVGQIPIRRGGGPLAERALLTGAEVLRAGGILALYPEGTRSLDDFVHRGRTGVARLALQADVPVIPVGIVGTEKVQPFGRRRMHPFKVVTIRFGPPMRLRDGDGDTDLAAEHPVCRAFTDELMKEISRLSGRPYVDEYIPGKQSS